MFNNRPGLGIVMPAGMPEGRMSDNGNMNVPGTLEIDCSRLMRARHERIYLLDRASRHEFQVMGNSGSAYIVRLKEDSQAWLPNCTCHDHIWRKVMCKHIIFVLVKVLHLTPPIHRNMLQQACDENGPASRNVEHVRPGDIVKENTNVCVYIYRRTHT